MSPLERKIIEKIRSEGPINFEVFMDMALYEPGLGYYTNESTTIGRAGDFYTSPHLHPIFGAMLGRQMEEMWKAMGSPERFDVVEMGAGMGWLAKDMLDYLGGTRGRRSELFPRIRYAIVELNESVRLRQKELLKDHPEKVHWIACLRDAGHVAGCILSNELLDAFPVRLVEMDDELREIYVSEHEGGLVEVKGPCSAEVREYFRGFSLELPEGYKTEVNLRMRDWLQEVSAALAEGFLLTVDYGYPAWDYYGEDRSRGTLMCYYRHQVNEDPYRNIGEQDLTAHVNFSSLKAWGEEAGLKTVGFSAQGTYLVSLGIDEVIAEFSGETPDPFEIAKIKGLIMPGGMGESHKVMIQYKGSELPILRGFSMRNQLRFL